MSLTKKNTTQALQPPKAWAHLPFFTDYWPTLHKRLIEEENWLPGPAHVFAAFEAVTPAQTRVILLGQDPYPTPGHANGLAFSVTEDTPLPRSLRNIFKEMEDDLGAAPENGNLDFWARQGVMLLNTALSVPAGQAGGHARLGWQALPRQVVAEAQRHGPIAFLLWGRPALAAVHDLARDEDLVIATPHPSPLSARRGFFGSHPFSRINTWLKENRGDPIDWIGSGQ